MRRNGKTIIFTDLDGSFLDEQDYSFLDSAPALRVARERGVPVVFCSSKTRAEIESLRNAVDLTDPFVVENGGAIYIPRGYFPFLLGDAMARDEYEVIELGEPYRKLVDSFRLLRGGPPTFNIVGFSDLTPRELARECGMTIDEAERAKAREYSEPFRFSDITQEKIDIFLERIRQSGLQYAVGGRYYHLQGKSDKGHAVKLLTSLYRRDFGQITTVGIGDSPNDAPMLSNVTIPAIVKRPCGDHHPDLVKQFSRARLTEGVGPRGWNDVVLHLVNGRI
jgi:mannosyl-3-phosphoglycerate phosphatase